MNDLVFAEKLQQVRAAGLIPKNATQRAENWLQDFLNLLDETGDDAVIVRRELMTAISGAKVSCRVPDKSAKGWTYAMVADTPTRLQAIRLYLAYRAGLPPSQADLRVTVSPSKSADVSNLKLQVSELREIGVSLRDVVAELERQLPGDHGPVIDVQT